MNNGMKISLLALSLPMASSLYAQELCSVSYETVNQWQSGGATVAQQRVVLTNHGTALDNWELSWKYNAQENIQQLWGGQLSQQGQQITVKNAAYNGVLPIGHSVDFGFIVHGVDENVPGKFFLNGQSCDGGDNSPVPETPEPDQPDGEPPVTPAKGNWTLDNSASVFNFLTVKNKDNLEVQTFNTLQGSVSESGLATLSIDLNSLDTGITLRDQRMRDFLFEADVLPTLYYRVQLNVAELDKLATGTSLTQTLSGTLTLHGVQSPVNAQVLITRLNDGNISVSTVKPVLVNAADFDLSAGVEAMRTIAGLMDIADVVPVTFKLWFKQNANAEMVAVPSAPITPASPMVTASNGTGQLIWLDNSTNETAFIIRQRNTQGHWETVATLGQDQNVLAELMLMQGSNDYKVIAINGSVPSAPSEIASVLYDGSTTPDPEPEEPGTDDPGTDEPDNEVPDTEEPDVEEPDVEEPGTEEPDTGEPEPTLDGQALYQQQCSRCHGDNGDGFPIGVPLNQPTELASFINYIEVAMPAGNAARCGADCAQAIGEYIESAFWSADPVEPVADETPGPRQLSLLSRYQYGNTVKDLLGINADVVRNFPVEAKVNGYDNNAANNVVTSRHVTEYMDAAATLAQQAVSQNRNNLVQCDTQQADCRRSFVQGFGRKAFRRDLSNAEINDYVGLFDSESGSDSGLQLVIRAMLMSPNFLYISEMGTRDGDHYRLSQFEIASLLSYMFWGTMPDNGLLQTARNNQLSTPAQIESAARRLLSDNRARTHMGHFVEQWLEADRGNIGSKDANVYPRFNANVRDAMDAEMKAFFNHVVFDSTQQFDELFNADYVFVNSALAGYYGISGVNGNQMQMVPDSSGNRGGLLSLGAVMAAHGHSNETAPIPRGKFVRKKIMCQDFPEPPVDLDTSFPDPDPSLTTREKFAARTAATECQDCHRYLNGVGFGFEAFDGAGAYRTSDNGKNVDVSGVIIGMASLSGTDQTSYSGVRDMQQVLAEADSTKACVARQFYRFARGYSDGSSDVNTLKNLTQLFEASNYNLQEMMIGVTQLQTFALRRNQ